MRASDPQARVPGAASWKMPRVLALSTMVVALGLSVAGCQHTKEAIGGNLSLGEKTVTSISATGDLPAPTARAWPNAGQDVLNQQARGFGLARMPELETYLNRLYTKIKSVAGVSDWPGSVYILATTGLEAYATAAGNIYLAPGWVDSAESEDEIVALLAHEFGHIYLHYHQVAGVVENTNQAAQIAAGALALAKSKSMDRTWTPVDSLLLGYVATRELSVGNYGRTEEISADSFGLNLSLKLGYSYDSGIKAFLERIASWEERNEKPRQAQKEQIRLTTQQQAKENSLKKNLNGSLLSNALAPAMSELDAGLATVFLDARTSVEEGLSAATAKHPDINVRIERQAMAVEKLPAALTSRNPVINPLVAARTQPATAARLKNYRLAGEALLDINAPGAVDKAKLAASGSTANHALPLVALYSTQKAQGSTTKRNASVRQADLSKMLELNFNSPPDRAWVTYVERALYLQSIGDIATAKKVIDSGMSYFRPAPEAWPQAIQFYGQTQGWQMAKNLAMQCRTEHPSMTGACNEAATSPAEKAEMKRVMEAKGEKAADKMLQKMKLKK